MSSCLLVLLHVASSHEIFQMLVLQILLITSTLTCSRHSEKGLISLRCLQVWIRFSRVLWPDSERIRQCQHPSGDICVRLPVHGPRSGLHTGLHFPSRTDGGGFACSFLLPSIDAMPKAPMYPLARPAAKCKTCCMSTLAVYHPQQYTAALHVHYISALHCKACITYPATS